jgi:hypothetical protein
MTNSDLIIFLPLVGAILGAWANGLYRDWQDKKARRRERVGLLTLIFYEVDFNDSGLKVATLGPARTIIAHNLRTDAWDEAQSKLAPELPFEYLRQLAHYYGQIKLLKALPLAGNGELSAGEQEFMQRTMEVGKAIMHSTQTYFPPEFRRDSL